MDGDSTNLRAPWLGPTVPIYPEIPQLIEAAGAALPGNIYPAFVRQFTSPLGTRRREPCFLVEPNGVQLGPAIYDSRLVSSFQGLPLYATHCCVPIMSSNSSSSSGSPAPGVRRIPLGSAQGGYPATISSITLANVTLPSNCLLGVIGSMSGFAATIGSVRWGPYTLGVDSETFLPPNPNFSGVLAILSAFIEVGGTHDIVLTATVAGFLTIQAVEVLGLYDNVSDQSASASGQSSNPDSGPTGQTTGVPGYAQGAMLMLVPAASFAWKPPFQSGGQDQSATVSGVVTTASEGWTALSAIQAVDAALLNPAANWAACCASYF
jgi:hypothetical protein